MALITFQRVTRDDFPLLQRWLAAPHAARMYVDHVRVYRPVHQAT